MRAMEHRSICALAAATLLSACAHVTNSPLCASPQDACDFDPNAQTTYRFTPRADKETLVIVTFSGGGSRAAALAYGVLQGLATLDPANETNSDGSASLLDQVDIVSSVSGGSLTAGWYALKGRKGLAQDASDEGRLWAFLNQRWTSALAWEALNPVALGRYAFTSYERNDVLADFFDSHLFDGSTYAEVLKRYKTEPHQPYVILNATDLGHEAIFPFTQGRFDLLCADLTRYRLAEAVAASSNFPLAFSPLGLENFSGCAAQHSNSWMNSGPPQWLNYYDRFDLANAAAPHSYQLNEIRSARLAQDYLLSPAHQNIDQYLHLLDGGVADNLGIRTTLAIEDDPARVPSLYLRLGSPRPEGYQSIRRVLYIVVNARTHNPGPLDKHMAPPGEIATALRMIDTQLDSSTLADQDYLIAELESMVTASSAGKPATPGPVVDPCANSTIGAITDAAFLSCKPNARAHYPAPDGGLHFYVAAVDFEMIADKTCRDNAWLLPTNFGLKPMEVQAVVELGKSILMRSRDLTRFYSETNHQVPAQLQSPPTLDQPCTLLLKPGGA